MDMSYLSLLAAAPASILVAKICKAVGVVYEPRRIIKNAEAQAEANLILAENDAKIAAIKAHSDVEVSDIMRRAAERFVAEETRKQINMENTITKAIPFLDPSSNPDNMDDDWIVNFFNKTSHISNEQMQTLIAKILAGEANQPSTFSKRTVNIVSELSRQELELFERLCPFVCNLADMIVPVILNPQDAIYQWGLSAWGILTSLDKAGLIVFDSAQTKNITSESASNRAVAAKISYFDNSVTVGSGARTVELEVGHVVFSASGRELYPIFDCQPVDGFWQYVQEHWRKKHPNYFFNNS